MPLGTREVLLFLRAKDQASRIINEVGANLAGMGAAQRAAMSPGQAVAYGSALTGVGLAATAMGAAGIAAFVGMAKAAIDYSNASALTFTQVRNQAETSLAEIKDIGLDVARTLPVAFETIQPALFDIFSSMEVGASQARVLLMGMGKAAIAGATDIQTASRSIITVMNGFNMAMGNASETSASLNKALDFQFTMVKRGIGTYEEFASVIGRAVPAFAAAGQTMEQLGGAMTFLTQRGLSTAMAATSAARAIELLTKPQSIANMEAMGISVRDATGEFLPLNEIVTQLGERFADMTRPERIAAFSDLFGQGTIQARRFFALAIENFEAFNAEVAAFTNNAGTMEDAFKTMMLEPAQQLELIKNRLHAVAIEFGGAIIPIVLEAANAFSTLVDGFANLDPEIKTFLARGAMLTSVLLVIVGLATTLVGVWNMMAGGLARFSIFASQGAGAVAAAAGAMRTFAGAAFGAIAIVSALGFSLQDIIKLFGTLMGLAGRALGNPFVQATLSALVFVKALQTLQRAWVAFLAISRVSNMIALVQTFGLMGAAALKAQRAVYLLQLAFARLNTVMGVVTAAVALFALLAIGIRNTGKETAEMVDGFKELSQTDPGKAIRDIGTAVEETQAKLDQWETESFLQSLKTAFTEDLPNLLQGKVETKGGMEDRLKALADAAKYAQAQFDAANPAIAQMSANLTQLGGDAGMAKEEIAFMTEEAEKVATEMRDSFLEAGNIWEEFAGQGTASIDAMIKKSQELVNVAESVASNMQKLLAKGVPSEMLQGIVKSVGVIGAEGIFKGLLAGSDEALHKLVALQQQFGILGDTAGAAMGEASSGLAGISQSIAPLLNDGKMLASAFIDAKGSLTALIESKDGLKELKLDEGLTQNVYELAKAFGISKEDARLLKGYLNAISQQRLDDTLVQLEGLLTQLGLTKNEASGLLNSIRATANTPMDALTMSLDALVGNLGITQTEANDAKAMLQDLAQNGQVDLATVSVEGLAKALGISHSQAADVLAAMEALNTKFTTIHEIKTVRTGVAAPNGPLTAQGGSVPVGHMGGLLNNLGKFVRSFHVGGPVYPLKLDSSEVAAVLQKGEYVINRKSVRDIGISKLNELNARGRSALDRDSTQSFGRIRSSVADIFRDLERSVEGSFDSAGRSLKDLIDDFDDDDDDDRDDSRSSGKPTPKVKTMKPGTEIDTKTKVEKHYHLHMTGGEESRVLNGFNMLKQFEGR